MNAVRPPRFASLLLRLWPLGARRAEVEADLAELFTSRMQTQSARVARRRYYRDVLSLAFAPRIGSEVLIRAQPDRLRQGSGGPPKRSAKAEGRAYASGAGTRPLKAARAASGEHESWRTSRVWNVNAKEVVQDLTYAGRLLRRSPGVVAITIAGLGIAIGVSASVFTLLNAVAFRSTGVFEPSSVVQVLRAYRTGIGSSWKYSDYLQLRESAGAIRLEASIRDGAVVGRTGERTGADAASLTFVTGGYLSTLSHRALLGRLLIPADDTPGAAAVAVLSYAWWSRRLGADPSVVGQPIWVNGTPLTVVGIAERGFIGTMDTPPSMWLPAAAFHVVYGGPPLDRASSTTVSVLGRVAVGASKAQAEAELSSVARQLSVGQKESSGPASFTARSGDRAPAPDGELIGVRFEPFASHGGKGGSQTAIAIITVTTVIGLVLLLACVNVANLLLASAISREREIGVRLAIGASRGRLVRQLLTESLSLGLAGGLVGLLITRWFVPVAATILHAPDSIDLAPDLRVILFLGGTAVLSAIGAGLAPARHAIRNDLTAPLRGANARTDGIAGRPRRLRSGLVGVQAGASLLLLVMAALLTRGTMRAARLDVGFDAGRLLVVTGALGRGTSEAQADAYWSVAAGRVQRLPGVHTVALASYPPFGNANEVTIFRRAGSRYTIFHNQTQSDYFKTIGLRAIRGRTYTADEVAAGANVVVISEAVARDFFPGEDPVGQSLERVIETSRDSIIGVVSNAFTARLRDLSSAAIYKPMRDPRGAKLVIRTAGTPEALVRSVRSALEPIDSRVSLDVQSVNESLQRQIDEPRVLAMLASVLAALALGLAVVGIYGVTTFVVGQRRQEIGVRLALGATARDVLKLLLADSLRPIAFGLCAGVLAALITGRVLAGLLFGVSPVDPIAFAVAVLTLLSTAIIAVIFPTRRAASVDPVSVLRQL
jgi:predicted permease